MELNEFLEHMNRGDTVIGGSETHLFMHGAAQDAMRITAELNGAYHTPEEIRALYCGHCAPCPVGINVASVTKYLNLCLAQGNVPVSERGHYELLDHHGGECIACGRCESNCPFGVGIIGNMKKAAELFGF